MTKLTIVGGGRMGSALLAGLISNGWAQVSECAIVERDPQTRERLESQFAQLEILDAPRPSEAVVLAVKPQDLEEACHSLPVGGYERVLSIAAGVTTTSLESWLWEGAHVVRAMPNTPALLGVGASAIAPGNYADESDVIWAQSVLSAIGIVVRLPESLLDAATGLSGSGPAYIFMVAEALIAAGVQAGLDQETSRVLVLQTILGAARMLNESGESPEELRAAVTSPHGTTAEGVRVLEACNIRGAFDDAVRAATERSRELGAR